MTIIQNTYKVIGLMSGTSLDGLDVAYCHFKKHHKEWSFSIQKTASIEYTPEFKDKLKKLGFKNAVELLTFHNNYGTWLGEQIYDFIKINKVEVDFISSHGHTVFHQPEIGVTYQIGSGQHLANASGIKTICDFRTNDVALGGQGAPLVPVGDQLLFSNYEFCLNLGGISNISFQIKDTRIAYDISPANMLLNYICKKINLEYDAGGKLAQIGKLNKKLLKDLNALDFYKQPYPKSLGHEWFVKEIIPCIENTKDSIENLLHTSVHHIAFQISQEIKNTELKDPKVLITGGGAKNKFLIDTLKQFLAETQTLIIPDENTIDFKEALIFAFLGVLRTRNEMNCLSSVTGAIRDSSSGVIFNPSVSIKVK